MLDVEPPQAWKAARTPAGSPPQRWWEQLGEPRLTALIEEALAHNRSLQATAARIAEAAAEARRARGARFPELAAGATGTRQRRNFVGFGDVFGAGRGGVLSTTFNQFGVSLDVSWELDLWGRLAAADRAAHAELSAARAELDAARLSLAGQTAKAWLAAVEASEQLALAEQTVANYEATAERVAERYRRGIGSPADVRLARAELAEARALLELRRRQADGARRQLE
ncbi:MAG: hypothetical protein D6815_04390, partial [Candidatus Dadabacteria bacterium]